MDLTIIKRLERMKSVLILFKKMVYTIIVVLYLFIVGCSNSEYVHNISNADYSLYDEIIKNIDKEPYDEIHWLSQEATGGIIVYNDTKLKDIDGDGVDELFVLRRYIKPMTNAFGMSSDYYSTLENFNLFAIQHSFISESYRIKNNKVEELLIDNEPVSTQAFGGGHFGVYYYLLDGGRIAMYSSSYWDENLKIYNNLELETTILHIGNMETSEWEWKVNGKKSTQSKVSKILKEIVN